MTTKPAHDRTVLAAQATLHKALEQQWRAWSALIAELDDERQAAERASDPDADLFEQPAPIKANIPMATRKQLLTTFDARLQTAQAEAEAEARQQGMPAPDVEAVRARLIIHIGKELRGEVNEKGLALVYWKGKLVPFDHRAIMRGTSKADYLAAGFGGQAGNQRQTLIVVVGAIAAILVALYVLMFVLLAPSKPRQIASVAEARIGDATVTRWDVTAAGSDTGVPITVDKGRVSYPLVVCAPEKQAATLGGATVTITGTESLRTYRLAQTGADLRVVSCENPQRALAQGSLLDATVALAAPDGRVRDVWVRGPSADPQQIPADRMEVTLLVDPEIGEASLVLLDGTRLSPSARTPAPAGLELRFLAPLASVPQQAGLHEQAAGGMPQISAIMLPAPEPRVRYLDHALGVTVDAIARSDAGVQVTLRLTARTGRGEDLPLKASDIQAFAGNKALAPSWEPVTLAGDETPQSVLVTLPADAGPITLSLGTWHAAILP